MNAMTKIDEKPRRQVIEVRDPIPLLDTAQFEHMQRIAAVMAQSTLVPEALYTEGPKDKKVVLPYEQILSNCFLVVNQSVRWGMDPFAVAQCVSVVHGKLCYEGKLVSAVLDAKLGVRLYHHFTGDGEATRVYLSDREFDAETIGELKPGFRKPGWRLFDGSVAEWKTTGTGTPWTPKNYARMLIYRGTRDWTRIYESAIMLGVYTPDEMLDLSENARAMRATDVSGRPSLGDRLAAGRALPQAATGSREGFDRQLAEDEPTEPAGEAPVDQEPSSIDTGDDAGSGEAILASPAADDSAAADLEAGGEAQDGPDAPPADQGTVNLVLRNKMVEAIGKFIKSATDPKLTAPQRQEAVVFTKNVWKDELPERPDFVKACTDLANQVVLGKIEETAARVEMEKFLP